jgi:nucleoid-associated protein YgaU
MDIYLIDQNGGQLHLPVNPPTITLDGQKAFDTVNIINVGEVDFVTGDKRSTIEFSSFFPMEYDTFCRYVDIPNPQEALNQLINMRIAGKPVRLIITDTIINTLVLLTGTPYSHTGEQDGDILYTLQMRTYKEVKVRTKADLQQSASARPDNKATPKTYTVKSGDTLFGIAKMLLGDSSRYTDIYNMNKTTIGASPDRIQIGMKLELPA